MSSYEREIENCISALHAIRLSLRWNATSAPMGQTARDVIAQLGGIENPMAYRNIPLQMGMARAIHQTFLGDLPPDLGDQPRQAPSES